MLELRPVYLLVTVNPLITASNVCAVMNIKNNSPSRVHLPAKHYLPVRLLLPPPSPPPLTPVPSTYIVQKIFCTSFLHLPLPRNVLIRPRPLF